MIFDRWFDVFLISLIISQHSQSLQFDIAPRLAETIPGEHKRIVKGKVCYVRDYPYMVSLRLVDDMKHMCGGTILSRKSVLTAAHCVSDYSKVAHKIVVAAGVTEESTTLQIRHVDHMHIPPGYNSDRAVSDISIMILEHPLDFNEVVQPVILNPWHAQDVVKYCTKGMIIGWGSTVAQKPRVPHEEATQMFCAYVPVLSYWECQKYINLIMELSKFCAIGKGEDACAGDSGGPMMCGGVQIGVISTGNGCGDRDHPGIYARVDYHFKYIKKMMNGQERHFNIRTILVLSTLVEFYRLFDTFMSEL